MYLFCYYFYILYLPFIYFSCFTSCSLSPLSYLLTSWLRICAAPAFCLYLPVCLVADRVSHFVSMLAWNSLYSPGWLQISSRIPMPPNRWDDWHEPPDVASLVILKYSLLTASLPGLVSNSSLRHRNLSLQSKDYRITGPGKDH